jgi:SHS2 domain-containing protein
VRIPRGVAFLDHTADVGIAVQADSLGVLFHHAALGMLALLRGEEEGGGPGGAVAGSGPTDSPGSSDSEMVPIELTAPGVAGLLAAWLGELLFMHEAEHRDYVAAEFDSLEATALRARVRTEPAARAVREIKGVTYHELVVEPTARGWAGQVIFDV